MSDYKNLLNFVIVILLLISESTLAEKVVLHTVIDKQRNMAMHQIPLPASWKIVTPNTIEDPSIIGPNGIKIYYRNGGSYVFSNDPYMQQIYSQSGQQMRPPVSAQQIVEQDLAPQLNKHGLQLEKVYPLPEIAQRSQTYSNKLYKSMPTQQYFDAAGSEWSDGKGNTILVIVDQIANDGQGSVFWYYSLKVLEAPDKHFEEAKVTFIYGIVNTQDNPQQIQAYNLSEQQKSNQSWNQHNARMKQNQQNFERQQAIHKSTSDAINRSINSTYQNQNASSDRLQDKQINVIRDESTVTNPHDGEQYQVEAGADHYWMNSDGEYIPSNDPNYNPNLDPNNNREWQYVEPEY
ncbi:MAG: hypothetical protein R8G33_07950 [Gammaproteobacteria bacterium]|nr:hypothetical protein [Gammaproteobacteria bacterium]